MSTLADPCLPITALAFFRPKPDQLLLLAGTGAELVVYDLGSDDASSDRTRSSAHRRELARIAVLDRERVHGLRVIEEPDASRCWLVCYGGREVAVCILRVISFDDAILRPPEIDIFGKVVAQDWIFDTRLILPRNELDASATSSEHRSLICLTAHNTVQFYSLDHGGQSISSPPRLAPLRSVEAAAQPLLFCGTFGPIIDLGPSDACGHNDTHSRQDPACHDGLPRRAILVAAGTAIGPLYLWLCPLSPSSEAHISVPSTIVRVYEGHAGAVFDMRFSPDGTQLASVSDERTVQIWEVPTTLTLAQRHLEDGAGGAQPRQPSIAKLWGHTGRIWRLAWSGEEQGGRQTLVSVGEDGRGIGWTRSVDGQWIKSALYEGGHDGRSLWSVAADQNSQIIATGGADGAVRLWPSPASEDPMAWRTHPVRTPGRIESPYSDSIKAFEALPTGQVLFVTRRGSLYSTDLSAFARESTRPVLLLEAAEDLGGTEKCRFDTASSTTFLAGTKGILFAIPLRDAASVRRHRLIDTTVSAWQVVAFEEVPWGLVYDSRQKRCRLFQLEKRTSDLTALADFDTNCLAPITSMHLLRLETSSQLVFLAGTMNGQVAIWHFRPTRGDSLMQASPPLKIHQVNAIGIPHISSIDSPTGSTKPLVRTLGRDGVLAEHVLKEDLTLETRDVRQIMHGHLERLVGGGYPEKQESYFAGIEEGRCKVFRKTGELVAQCPCETKHRSWMVTRDVSAFVFLFNQSGRLLCYRPSHHVRLRQPLVRVGSHGREVRCVALHDQCDGGVLAATGAENGVLRITAHPSSERSRLLFMDQTLDSSLKSVLWFRADADDSLYLVVAGTRELLRLVRVTSVEPGSGLDISVLPWITASAATETSEIRIMDLDVASSEAGQAEIVAAYSDGSVRVWRLDTRARTSQVVRTFNSIRCCVLAVKWLRTTSERGVILSGGTNGSLFACSGAGDLRQVGQIHSNGINCMDAVALSGEEGQLLVFTGGDDAVLAVSSLTPQGASSSLELASEPARQADAHSSSITGLKALVVPSQILIVTASVDQTIKLWSFRNDSLTMLDKTTTHVADVGALDFVRHGQDLVVHIVGIGSQTMRFMNCIEKTTSGD